MEERDGASAYGASLAGRGFDFQKFVRQPQTIVRLLSWVSAKRVHGGSSSFFNLRMDHGVRVSNLCVCVYIYTYMYIRRAHAYYDRFVCDMRSYCNGRPCELRLCVASCCTQLVS